MASFHCFFLYDWIWCINKCVWGPTVWIGCISYRSPSYGHPKQIFAKFENFLWALLIWRGVLKGGRGVRRHLQLFLNSCRAQSRQSAKLILKSSELGLPQTLSRRRVCPPPLDPRGGAHSLAREGVGESQYRRGDINCGTLYICTLCCRTEISRVIYSKERMRRRKFTFFIKRDIGKKISP